MVLGVVVIFVLMTRVVVAAVADVADVAVDAVDEDAEQMVKMNGVVLFFVAAVVSILKFRVCVRRHLIMMRAGQLLRSTMHADCRQCLFHA